MQRQTKDKETRGSQRTVRISIATTLSLIVVVFCACLMMGGCAQSQQPSTASTQTITDAYNRSVEVPTNPQSVATVGSAARFVVYAGAQDKLIAVTEMETQPSPARPYTKVYESLFTSLPSTSNGNHLMETSVDTEKLLSLKPDVIISSRSAAECDELSKAIGIPVVGISYQDQLFADTVYNSISVCGQALGTQEHAEAVVAAMKAWAIDLDKRTVSIDDADRPSCYAGAVNYKGAKSFAGTYAHYAPFEAVHANNVTDSTGQSGSVQIELEQLGEWNPDFMFLNAGNMDLMKQDYANNPDFFNSLTAFNTGNLYTQPTFNYNGTNVEMGIADAYFVGATLYPDSFADLDLAKQYDEIFNTMLGANYYETMKASGMDFKKLSFS